MGDTVDVREATHVKTSDGKWHRIIDRWGISPEGHLAKPSEGGFGVVVEGGKRVSAFQAMAYAKHDGKI